jgi:hypothetical protein
MHNHISEILVDSGFNKFLLISSLFFSLVSIYSILLEHLKCPLQFQKVQEFMCLDHLLLEVKLAINVVLLLAVASIMFGKP